MQALLQQSENRQNEQRKSEMQEQTNLFIESLEPLKAIADKLPILEFELSNLKQRVSSLEKLDKKLNVIIHGLREVEKEGVKERDDVIKELANLLRLPAIDYADAYRVGRMINNKPRPLIVKLVRFKEKIDILKSKRHLKGTYVFINDDLTVDERKSNSKLQEKKRDIMRSNNRAKCSIRFGKLHVESEGRHETFYVNPVTFEVEQRAFPSQRTHTLSGQPQCFARL
jgi:DNA repair exonuclease SbcCD ATPase subunit